jgi:HlyD family secretion protein
MSVHVREGDRVGGGEVVITLDDREARALVRQAEASLAEVRASTTQSIEDAAREAEQAQRDLARVQNVFRDGGLTQQTVEQAQQRAADARSRVEALRAAGAVGSVEPASVARATAALEAALARLALTRVTAPTAGTILSRLVEPGDAVSPGRVLLDMAFDGPTELVVFPGEENLASLKVGGPATASTDAFPDRVFDAEVALIAPSVDPTQGTIEVRLSVPSPPSFLLPDMTVSVNIETGRKAGAWVISESAVEGLGTEDPWVGVVRQGRVERQPVEVGLRAVGHVEIVAGIAEDDTVVVGAAGVGIGSRVRVEDPNGG